MTNPGGHSSAPRKVNAINELAAALIRIGNYQFKPEVSDLTRTYFNNAAKYQDPKIGAAMRAFAADPTDKAAIATLTDNPATIGKIGTTCVATMVSGGHALNALPQRATANINCRIFPGHPRAAIMAELAQVAADPAIKFEDVTEGSVATDASPMRPDLVAAMTKAIDTVYPGTPVFPSHVVGRQRQHVVPLPRRRQLWRQPGVHEGLRRFRARAERARADRQLAAGGGLLSDGGEGSVEVGVFLYSAAECRADGDHHAPVSSPMSAPAGMCHLCCKTRIWSRVRGAFAGEDLRRP